MASALSKRQQARNERTLQELIRTVPGNSACADCGARNPGWASWSMGIFLCMRCAALHRKLGTHISKVKSLSMDKWDGIQVDNMKRIGNLASNKAYNPRNAKPDIPIDIDQVDGAMERFIRQKYEQRIYMNPSPPPTRHNTGSTSSDDRPPPLPPKPTARFGFGLRKASTSPRNLASAVSSHQSAPSISPPRVNKPSRVFGSNVNPYSDGLESKLATLRDMGFPDEKRNSTVLKALNGNLDKAVEALIRLGEQTCASTKSRSNTPTSPAKPGFSGLSFGNANNTSAATLSTNPFDAVVASTLGQVQVPYGASLRQTPVQPHACNPFLSPNQPPPVQQQQQQQQQQHQQQLNPFIQPQQSLEQSFQNMDLSSQQPLFPNRTGGHGPTYSSQYASTNPFHHQPSFTPPMPSISEQSGSLFTPQPHHKPSSVPATTANPFLKPSRSQILATTTLDYRQDLFQQPPIHAPQQSSQPLSMSSPWMLQQQQQQQQQQQHLPSHVSNSWPFQQQNYPPSALVQAPDSQPQHVQLSTMQGSSGVAGQGALFPLYHDAQLAPQAPQQPQPTFPVSLPAFMPPHPVANGMDGSSRNGDTAQHGRILSAAQTSGLRHASHESVDFTGLMGGRHSPDAFSALSASYQR